MELIVISESKIKIMLTEPDMRHYHLNTSDMNCSDEHTQAAFRHIFADAHKEIGFDTEGKRLFVQLYTSAEGGCEIFVTALERKTRGVQNVHLPEQGLDDQPNNNHNVLSVYSENMSIGEKTLLEHIYDSQIEESSCASRQLVMFRFTELKSLLQACHRLLCDGYKERSAVFVEETLNGDMWYLSFYVTEEPSSCFREKISIVAEYGRQVAENYVDMYLGEHGRCICQDEAVQILGIL